MVWSGLCGQSVLAKIRGEVAERMDGFRGMDLDWCSEGAAVVQTDAGPG